MAEFEKLDSAEETQFVPGTRGYAAYGPEQVLSWPYASLGGGPSVEGETVDGISETITYDAIPLGEVAVRRGQHVHATDGDIGLVEGLVIDQRNHHVTHVLLQEGHLLVARTWRSRSPPSPTSRTASGSTSPSRKYGICHRWSSIAQTRKSADDQ